MKIKVFKHKKSALVLSLTLSMILVLVFIVIKPALATDVVKLTMEDSMQKHQARFGTVNVDGLEIFYREAGPETAPTIILLQGLSSSVDSLLKIIPRLSNRFHVLAPNYPGYGNSASPETVGIDNSADQLAFFMTLFKNKKGVSQYGLLVEHKSAPIAVRMALQNPQQVEFLITRNGDEFEDHLAAIKNSIRDYWINIIPHKSKSVNVLNRHTDVTWSLSNQWIVGSNYKF